MDTISRLATLAVVGACIFASGNAAHGQSFAGGAAAGPAIGAGRSAAAPATVRAPIAVHAVPTAPLRQSPVWRAPVNVAHEGYVQQTPAAGRNRNVQLIPGTVGASRAGLTTRPAFDNREHRRRAFPRREIRPYYGAAVGGYGYPYLYVQTYGYPFSALPFGPAEVYAESAVSENVAAPEATPAEEPDSLVQDVQSELIRRGYFAGKATGIVTKEFQAALCRFQADQHLASSGLINEASLFALGLN